MRKIATVLFIAVLLALVVCAFGCNNDKSADHKDTTTTQREDTTTTQRDETNTQTDDEYVGPGSRYDPYPTPEEGELVTPSDYDLGLREGYEEGYWVGLSDGRRGIFDDQPGVYDDSNEYYVEGYLEGYVEGYEDGNLDGQEM